MKTIAAAAILAILSAPAFADDKTAQTTETPKAQAPIVLSAQQLDKVTAGQDYFIIKMRPVYITSYQTSGSSD